MNVHASEFELLSAAAVTCGIPRHMVQGVVTYSLIGLPTGDFLQRIISNDLFGAYQHADYLNKPQLHRYAEFFLLHAPEGCYGSQEIYEKWVQQRGKAGLPSETSELAKNPS